MSLKRYLDNDLVKIGLSAAAGYAAGKGDVVNKVVDYGKQYLNKFLAPKQQQPMTVVPAPQAVQTRHELIPAQQAQDSGGGEGLIAGILRFFQELLGGR